MGLLTNMQSYFAINNNHLTGEIPAELAALSALTKGFSLTENELCGDEPEVITAMNDQV